MTHIEGHIICGGLGRFLRWILVWLKDHEFLNAAVFLKRDALREKGWSEQEISRYGEMIDADVRRWYEVGERKGLEYHYYEPFHGNPLPVPDSDPDGGY